MKSLKIALSVLLVAACAVTGCSKKDNSPTKAPTPVDTTISTEPDPKPLIATLVQQRLNCEKEDDSAQSDQMDYCGAAGITAMNLEFLGYCQSYRLNPDATPLSDNMGHFETLKCTTPAPAIKAPKDVQDIMVKWAGADSICEAANSRGCYEENASEYEKQLYAKGWCLTIDSSQYLSALPKWHICLATDKLTTEEPYQEDGDVSEAPDSADGDLINQ